MATLATFEIQSVISGTRPGMKICANSIKAESAAPDIKVRSAPKFGFNIVNKIVGMVNIK